MTAETTGADELPTIVHARDSSGEPSELGVVASLSELARALQADRDMPTLLHHIVAATVEEIDGAEHGGISLVDGTTVDAVAATDPLVARVDQRQTDLNEGPCLSSLRQHITVRVDDLAADGRWPAFAVAAMNEGVRSMLSVQLFVDGDNLGALNLFAAEPKAFAFADEWTAMALASHAAVAIKGQRVESNLLTALSSRDVIGQAKGILMERYRISADEAFDLMVLASQKVHVKLREVAHRLTETGELMTGRP